MTIFLYYLVNPFSVVQHKCKVPQRPPNFLYYLVVMFSQINASSVNHSISIFQFAKTLVEFVHYHFEHSNQCMNLLSESSRSNLLFCEIISKPRPKNSLNKIKVSICENKLFCKLKGIICYFAKSLVSQEFLEFNRSFYVFAKTNYFVNSIECSICEYEF